jgi:hypothetical protein
MKIAIIADQKQAALLIQSNERFDHILSLCPTASYELGKANHKTVSGAQYYTSLSHAKNALVTSKYLDMITQCGATSFGLEDSEISGFRSNLLYVLTTLHYFYYATRHYRHMKAEFYTCSRTELQKFSNYEEMFEALAGYALRRYNHSYENTRYSTLHHGVAKFCNQLLFAVARAGKATRVVHFGESALLQIEQALLKQPRKLWVFKPRAIGSSVAQTLNVTLFNIQNILRGRGYYISYFRHTASLNYQKKFTTPMKVFEAHLRQMNIPFPLPAFFEHVVQDSGWYMTFLAAQYNAGQNLVRDLSPHLVMTNKGKYHFIRAAIAHLPKKSVGLLINHGTHTAQKAGTISQVAANLWASDNRICVYGARYMVPRLPLTARQVEELYPEHPEFICMPSVKRISRSFGNPHDIFRIVFAGNYIGTLTHVPWCAETADEYLLNLLELIDSISKIPRVQFIIKLKATKASAHMAILQERIDALGVSEMVSIDTKTRFTDMLKDVHLVISNLSTTIEEAVGNRVPVLLHTYRKKYFHLPCQFKLTEATEAGYVYGVRPGQDAGALIEAIRTYYQRIVAGDAMLDGIIWRDSQFNNLQELASQITHQATQLE